MEFELSQDEYILYQMLTPDLKVNYLFDCIHEDTFEVFERYWRENIPEFPDIGKLSSADSEIDAVAIMSFVGPDDVRINIFFEDAYMHINSNRLRPIKDTVKQVFMDGHIITRDYDRKKSDHPKQYYMRFFRSYKKLNGIQTFPIILN